jgi:hypothetical protein
MQLEIIRSTLEKAGVVFDSGLSQHEIDQAEKRFGFKFPADLRRFLMFALPTGTQFPNWRYLDDPQLGYLLAWPLEGIWFDVQNSDFWPSDWGQKPKDESEAYEQVRSQIAKAPKLIPIYSHRYMPDSPHTAGNPVLSIYQTDIIYYGGNLENYLHNEFHDYFRTPAYELPDAIRKIDFWSSFTS